MLIKPVKGVYPKIGDACFVAENATILGDVTVGNNCSIWFNAVLRGDVHYIKIGNDTNIQDHVVIHGTYEKCSTNIGNYVSIGHRAIVHGCTVEDHVLIGMGAILMDNAYIQRHCMIAAGSVLLENTICESGYLYAGVPAKKIKPLTDEQLKLINKLPERYIMYASWMQ